MSFSLAPGVVCYSWIPYSSDQTNQLLGAIVQVRLIEPFSLGWSAEICASGKPSAGTKRGSKVYLVPTELYETAADVEEVQLAAYNAFLGKQTKALLKAAS